MGNMDNLEKKGIFILNDAMTRIKNLVFLWSTGKDSTVVLALARKAFGGTVPFPVMHIDNGSEFRETYEFRDMIARDWKLDLVVIGGENREDPSVAAQCCSGKADALRNIMAENSYKGAISSLRQGDCETIKLKNIKDLRGNCEGRAPEIWEFPSSVDKGHIRIHPLLKWTELDIWRYIRQECLPVNPIYFSKNGRRFRNLGCTKCAASVNSDADTVDRIVRELEAADAGGDGKMPDGEQEELVKRLKALGYM